MNKAVKQKNFMPGFALIASAAAVITYNYFISIELPNIDFRMGLHREILNGSALAPYNYRVLVPFLTEAFAMLLSWFQFISYRQAWLFSYIVYDYLCITLFLATMFLYLKQWHGPKMSLMGVMFCAALLPASLRDHRFQPWTLLEAFLYCAALLSTFKKKYALIVIITVIASLNRLTGICIPFIYLLGSVDIKTDIRRIDKNTLKQILKFAGLLIISASIAVLLYYIQGFNGNVDTLQELWRENTSLEGLIFSSIHIILFAGAGWIMAVLGASKADKFTRQEAILIPLYMSFFFVFGIWREARLLIPLYPLILSLCLFYIGNQFSRQGLALDN